MSINCKTLRKKIIYKSTRIKSNIRGEYESLSPDILKISRATVRISKPIIDKYKKCLQKTKNPKINLDKFMNNSNLQVSLDEEFESDNEYSKRVDRDYKFQKDAIMNTELK